MSPFNINKYKWLPNRLQMLCYTVIIITMKNLKMKKKKI